MRSGQTNDHYEKMKRPTVTFVGSHLFEPTHYSLVALMHKLEREVQVSVFAKHPQSHPESGTSQPLLFQVPEDFVWNPGSDIVHAIGGGETAIKVAEALTPGVPLLVTFVGGADLSRQLRDNQLQDGYKRLFNRSQKITYADMYGYAQLHSFGVPDAKLIHIPAALPLAQYETVQQQTTNTVLMAGRPLDRKNHMRAVRVALQSTMIDKLILIGKSFDITQSDPRMEMHGLISHTKLIKLLTESAVLLQTGNWDGDEIDSLPTIVLEALAMGIPVVSTPLPGILELYERFPDFIKVCKNETEMSEKLDRLLYDRGQMAYETMRTWILKNYGLDTITQQVCTLYREILHECKY